MRKFVALSCSNSPESRFRPPRALNSQPQTFAVIQANQRFASGRTLRLPELKYTIS